MTAKRDADAYAALAELPTAVVSDALDRLGITGAALGIGPLANGQRLAGPAFTVRYTPAGSPPGTVGDYLDDVPPGAVVILDNGQRTDATVWGGILTTLAHQRGVAGTVIDGVCRDVSTALHLGYPVYSRSRFMRTGKDRCEVAEVGGTVTIGGVGVSAGDAVAGDDDGVVFVPAGRLAEVVEMASRIEATERLILDEALAGATLNQARANHSYHMLQRSQQD